MKNYKDLIEFALGFFVVGFLQFVLFIGIYVLGIYLTASLTGGQSSTMMPLILVFDCSFFLISSILGYVLLQKNHKMLALGILIQMIVNLIGIPISAVILLIAGS
jgi:hypothetical protein